MRNTYWILNISVQDENLEGEKEETEKNITPYELFGM